ncbi:helix-turn-helix domain-containing protein [Nesterenkonia cremea]|uniref:HTH cro/C1-type domain-containing protein n=1 Tax=Nesterenkonia cremea TaxID=1882340 RepID=A0A917ATD8_9MICC|nr:helix-turn-helix domain-containing protein [Nesterenkonia cremea]GGE74330.1 hypothetical protein GCM10011401_21990 [Nesterenkonia cremea]
MVRVTAAVQAPADLGLALQQARMEQGLSQMQLAEQLGISQRSVSEIESGKPTIYIRKVFEMMRATGMELTASWDEEPPHASGG